MSKFTDNASEKLLVVAGKISNQKHMASIKNAFYTLMPVILTGAVLHTESPMLCALPLPLVSAWLSCPVCPGLGCSLICSTPPTTRRHWNFFTVAAVFLIGMELAKQNGLRGESPDSRRCGCMFLYFRPAYLRCDHRK